MRALYIAIFILVSGCAGLTPEQKLANGYDSVTAVTKSTTVLLDRRQIPLQQAKNVSAMAKISKSQLDASADELAICRAKEDADCDVGSIQIDLQLSTGVLDQLEKYLEQRSK